jgi:hypothetical protein
MVARRERGMLLQRSHMPAGGEGCHSTVVQRRLSAAAKKSGVVADDGGLRASRKRRRRQNDGKALNDFCDPRGRNRNRVRKVIFFVADERSPGTADGRHRVSPICAPAPKVGIQSGRNRGRNATAPGIDRAFPFQCDDCATAGRCGKNRSEIAQIRRLEPVGQRQPAVDHDRSPGDIGRHPVRQHRQRHRGEVISLAETTERNVF